MTSDDPELERVLLRLRAQYLAEAPGRLVELSNALERWRAGDRQAPSELAEMLHRLAGSGGLHGLDAVTDRARAAEQAVHALASRKEAPTREDFDLVASHLRLITDAFAEAR